MNCVVALVMLAAREGERDFSWVVPILFVAIWIIGGIGKFVGGYLEDRKQRELQRPVSREQVTKMRYKSILDASGKSSLQSSTTMPQAAPMERVRERKPTPSRVPVAERKSSGTVASLKKAMHDAMEEAYPKHAKSQQPKAVPARSRAARPVKRTARPTARKAAPVARKVTKEPVRQVQVQRQEGSILSELLQKEQIRKAIIYSEIIGKPLALRDA